MFSLLFSLSQSTWYNFSRNNIDQIVKNSYKKPLFILLYAYYCPHCHGLPEGFTRYANGLGNRTDLYLSMIDCGREDGCGYFRITGTPTMYLVIGPKRRYWAKSPERCPEAWDRWVNERIGTNITKIMNQSHLEQALNEPRNGGKTFILEVPKEDHPLVKELEELSRYYRILDDHFFYKVIPNVTPNVKAYSTPTCFRKFTGGTSRLKDFVISNRFGPLHRYDKDEFGDLVKQKRKALIWVVEKELSEGQIQSLRDISMEHCGDFEIGWVSIGKDTQILKSIGANMSSVPFLYSLGFNMNKKKIYKGRVKDVWDTPFVSDLIEKPKTRRGQKVDIVLYTAIFGAFATMLFVFALRGRSQARIV